jgi:ribonuclease HI
MELEAALGGLRAVIERGWSGVELISDSSIALDIAAGRFLPKRHGALAVALREVAVAAGATTRWVRAHSGHRWNEVVDSLAREARRQPSPRPSPPRGRGRK